jgi:hypothetical protein
MSVWLWAVLLPEDHPKHGLVGISVETEARDLFCARIKAAAKAREMESDQSLAPWFEEAECRCLGEMA